MIYSVNQESNALFFFLNSIYIPGLQTQGPDWSRYNVSYRSYENKPYVRAPRSIRKQEKRVI